MALMNKAVQASGARLPKAKNDGPQGVSQAGPWPELRYPELANSVRRICTLCGWTQARAGTGQTLAITSAVEREGKSSLARAVAISTARDYAGEVLLLECDLLNPKAGDDFGTQAEPGLAEVLSGRVEVGAALRGTELTNLKVLPAGGRHENPSRLLRSLEMTALLQELRGRFAFVVVDLPAVLKSSDAAVLARLTDGVVLVVRAGATDQRAVQQAVELLSGATLHGVVLNRSRSSVPGMLRRVFGM